MLTVKILGPGCANCRRLEDVARRAAAEARVEAEFVKVTDYGDIVAHGVVATPGLIIGGRIVSQGKIPATETVAGWIAEARNPA